MIGRVTDVEEPAHLVAERGELRDHVHLANGHDDSVLARLQARVLSSSQLASLPAAQFLVDGLIPEGSLSLLYGPSGSLKSFIALGIAGSVSTCTPWCGLDVVPGPVVYVAAESPAGMGHRVNAWADHHGIGLEDLLGLHWVRGAVNLMNALEISALGTIVSGLGARLVIIDTLARCSVGGDENSAKDMGTIVAAADYIRSKGAAVLLVHHTGKDTDRGARGHSALKGAVDAELVTTRSKDVVTVRNDKQKDAAEAGPVRLRLVPQGDSAVLVHDPIVGAFRPTTLMERVSATLAAAGRPMSKRQIREATTGKNSGIDTALDLLAAEGHATVDTDGYRFARPYHAAGDPQSDSYTPAPSQPEETF